MDVDRHVRSVMYKNDRIEIIFLFNRANMATSELKTMELYFGVQHGVFLSF
jgi:hypothetical protein